MKSVGPIAAATDTATKGYVDGKVVDGPAPVTLAYAATIATDASLARIFRVTLTGNATLAAPTNPVDGQRVLWEFTASGGARTVTLATGTAGAFQFGTSITALNPVTSGATTILGAIYHAPSQRWRVLAISEGF